MAATEMTRYRELLLSEFNKVNKKTIVDTLVTHSIPEEVTNEVVKKFLTNLLFPEGNDEKPMDSDDSAEENVESGLNVSVKSGGERKDRLLEVKNRYLNKIVLEMESKNNILIQHNELLLENLRNLQKNSSLLLAGPTKNIVNKTSGTETYPSHSVRPHTSVNVSQRSNVENFKQMSSQINQPEVVNASNVSQPSTESGVNNSALNSFHGATKSKSENLESIRARKKLWNEIAGEEKHTDGSMAPEQKENAWQTVQNKKSRKHTFRKPNIICTGSNKNESGKLLGVKKKRWLYVGKIAGKDTTVEDVSEHLKDISGSEIMDIRKLNTKGVNSSFSIGLASDELYKSICNPNTWPEGVIIREFSFHNMFIGNKNNTGKANLNSTTFREDVRILPVT